MAVCKLDSCTWCEPIKPLTIFEFRSPLPPPGKSLTVTLVPPLFASKFHSTWSRCSLGMCFKVFPIFTKFKKPSFREYKLFQLRIGVAIEQRFVHSGRCHLPRRRFVTDRRRGLQRRRDRATARAQWTVSPTKTALRGHRPKVASSATALRDWRSVSERPPATSSDSAESSSRCLEPAVLSVSVNCPNFLGNFQLKFAESNSSPNSSASSSEKAKRDR